MKFLFQIFILILALAACRKGNPNENQPPETQIALQEINLTGDDRLNSEVRLNWFGTDVDGYVTGYEISLDNQNWNFTDSEDSTFVFPLPAGQDTTDIDFYVRAIDNDDNTDPTPAYLKVPLKNTPPSASFNDERGPQDTAFIAATFFWSAADPDGAETIQQILVRFNNGAWTEIDRNQNLISFLLDTSAQSGRADAAIFYGTQTATPAKVIDGVLPNAPNRLYIKSVDLAGAESSVDTSEVFFFKNKTPNTQTLWVSAHTLLITQEYRNYLNFNNINYDFLDFGIGQGERQPTYFDPTFELILKQYSRFFVNAPNSTFKNLVTGANQILLAYLAPIVQDFSNTGGKLFVTTSFQKNQDITNIRGAFPIDEILDTVGQLRIYSDSIVFPVNASAMLPNLQPTNVQSGIITIQPSADAQNFYRGEIAYNNGGGFTDWKGPNVLATSRSTNGKLRQVFFAIELHNFDKNVGTVENLIGQIFQEF